MEHSDCEKSLNRVQKCYEALTKYHEMIKRKQPKNLLNEADDGEFGGDPVIMIVRLGKTPLEGDASQTLV
jgi:hypothetical protein